VRRGRPADHGRSGRNLAIALTKKGEELMGKIVASYLLKVHLHADDDGVVAVTDAEAAVKDTTNDDVKQAVIDGVKDAIGLDVTVSSIERTDD
jgi:hypothetical protein